MKYLLIIKYHDTNYYEFDMYHQMINKLKELLDEHKNDNDFKYVVFESVNITNIIEVEK